MKILIGVTGSISAYRALDIVRGLTKIGHEVSVVLSKGAIKFVVADAFYYLGATQVHLPSSDFERERAGILHIDLAREHDLFVIAPASANTLSKLAYASADDTLSSMLLALRKDRDVLIFPSMNPEMWNSPAMIKVRDRLTRQNKNFNIFEPAGGEMACGEIGEGKLPSISAILNSIECWPQKQIRRQRRVMITTGATIAPLDPVRFLTNPSSGKTGIALARESLRRGDIVTLITGPASSELAADFHILPNFKEIKVKTTLDLFEAVKANIESCDTFISAGAPCDFVAPEVATQKIKKESGTLTTTFAQAPDVLAWVSRHHGKRVLCVGFAAETNLTKEVLEAKWQRKPTDYLLGTQVNGAWGPEQAAGFGTDEATYLLRLSDGHYENKILAKTDLAKLICSWERP